MQLSRTIRSLVFLGITATSTVAISACSHPQQYYNPYTGQYVTWNSDEDGYYRRWETERSMAHVEYQRRAAAEQRAYWDWRRNHQ